MVLYKGTANGAEVLPPMVVSFELGHGEESGGDFQMLWVVFLVPKWATLLLPQYLFYKYKGNQKGPSEIVDSYVIIYILWNSLFD